MVEHDHRYLRQPELLRSHQPPVAGDDHVVLANQDRIGEPELGDRGRDLGDLIGRVGPGVADVGDQPADRHLFDLQAVPLGSRMAHAHPRTRIVRTLVRTPIFALTLAA
jgi:hypothetical protein